MIGLENPFLVFLRVAVLDRFYCMVKMGGFVVFSASSTDNSDCILILPG